MRGWPPDRIRRDDTGEGASSYLAVVLLIGAMVVVIAGSGVGASVVHKIDAAVCKVGQGDDCTKVAGRAAAVPGRGKKQDCPDPPGRLDPGRSGRTAGDRRSSDEYPASCNSPSSHDQPKVTTLGPAQPGTNGTDPGPPPNPPHDNGSGKYKSESANWRDYKYKQQLYLIADAAKIKGLRHAADHMRHFLDGSGRPLEVDPQKMIGDMREFKDAINHDLAKLDCQLYNKAIGEHRANGNGPINMPFQGPWKGFYALKSYSQDWYYAIGGFSYETSGYVTVEPPSSPGGQPKVVMHYRVHVHDRYNWDNGKGVTIPGMGPVDDSSQQRLHRTGLAQEYDINGSTELLTRTMSPTCAGTVTNGPSGKKSGR